MTLGYYYFLVGWHGLVGLLPGLVGPLPGLTGPLPGFPGFIAIEFTSFFLQINIST